MQSFGDATFTDWGAGDNYLMKLDKESGAGVWVLQYGGQGYETLPNVVADAAGSAVYTVGLTWSHPAYFDPLVVDSHSAADGYDLFIAGLGVAVNRSVVL